MIQRLNDWSDSIAGGLEVFLEMNQRVQPLNAQFGQDEQEITEEFDEENESVVKNFFNFDKDLQVIDGSIQRIGESMDYDLNIERVRDRYIQVFEWLHLLSRQVNILLVIILIVICVNMISIILILVMERTQMIGLLKALGASNKTIRSVFVLNGITLIVKGLLLGNLFGLGLCFIQDKFKVITLNPHDYYMSFVPISWNWDIVILLNILMFLVVTFVLLFPTMIIASVNPIKAIRFD